jgi:hypothetical protein
MQGDNNSNKAYQKDPRSRCGSSAGSTGKELFHTKGCSFLSRRLYPTPHEAIFRYSKPLPQGSQIIYTSRRAHYPTPSYMRQKYVKEQYILTKVPSQATPRHANFLYFFYNLAEFSEAVCSEAVPNERLLAWGGYKHTAKNLVA